MNVSFLPEPTAALPAAQTPLAASTASDEGTIAALLETAEAEEQRRRFRRKIVFSFALCWLVFFVLRLPYLLFFDRPSLGWEMLGNAYSNAGALAIPLLMRIMREKSERLQRAAAALLKFPNETRRLLPLIDALHTPQTPEWKKAAYPALIEALWNLSATDAALSLDNSRRAALRSVLSGPYVLMPNGKRRVRNAGHFDDLTADLAVTVMKTLAQIGDEKTSRLLARIIKAHAKTPNETVVQDAAREYLPVLQRKQAENANVQRLMQPCFTEPISGPQKVLGEFLDTLSPNEAKIALIDLLRDRRQQSRAGDDKRLLPTLLSAIRSQSMPNEQQIATRRNALLRLLALLQPGDATLIPPAHRRYLRSGLHVPHPKKETSERARTLTRAALHAVAAIGDIKALPKVEKIVRATQNNPEEAELHHAALQCAEALRARKT